MSHIKDSFDDDELTELADEIRKDLLHQPNLHLNDSFVFKVQIDEHKQPNNKSPTNHESPPSWSYLSLSNTEYDIDTNHILTPYTPNIITPLTPQHLISTDSFPDIPSPKTSPDISNNYNYVNKYSQNLSQQLVLTDISSIDSEISPRNRKQKINIAAISDLSLNSNGCKKSKKNTGNASKNFLNFDEFKKNNMHTNKYVSVSMEVNVGI